MRIFRNIVIVTIILVLCAIALTGCGDKADESPADTTTGMPANTPGNTIDETIDTPSDNPVDGSDEVIEEGTVDSDENDVLKQLAFVYNENKIAIFDIVDDQKIESLIGKAEEVKSHTYSKDDGKNMDQLNGMTEKQYHFPGLVIKTIDGAQDKKFIIFSIEITDPKYLTIRNVKVGDSFEKLKEAYPEGNLLGGELSDNEDDFRYEPVNYVDVMNFHIKDKKVESILIYTLLD